MRWLAAHGFAHQAATTQAPLPTSQRLEASTVEDAQVPIFQLDEIRAPKLPQRPVHMDDRHPNALGQIHLRQRQRTRVSIRQANRMLPVNDLAK